MLRFLVVIRNLDFNFRCIEKDLGDVVVVVQVKDGSYRDQGDIVREMGRNGWIKYIFWNQS